MLKIMAAKLACAGTIRPVFDFVEGVNTNAVRTIDCPQKNQQGVTRFERERSKIDAIEFEQVEGVKKRAAVMLPAVQELKFREAGRTASAEE
jgi:hypothetical protein